MNTKHDMIGEAIDLIGLAQALIAPDSERVSAQQLQAGLRVMLSNVEKILLQVRQDGSPAASTLDQKASATKLSSESMHVASMSSTPSVSSDVEIIELEEDIFISDGALTASPVGQAPVVKSALTPTIEVVNAQTKKDAPLIARKAVQVSSTKLGGRLFS